MTCSLVFGILIVLWSCTNQLWSLLAKYGWSGVVKFGFGAAIQGSSAPLYLAGTKDLKNVPLMLILSMIISTLQGGILLVSRLPSCLLPLPLGLASDQIQQCANSVRKSSIQSRCDPSHSSIHIPHLSLSTQTLFVYLKLYINNAGFSISSFLSQLDLLASVTCVGALHDTTSNVIICRFFCSMVFHKIAV